MREKHRHHHGKGKSKGWGLVGFEDRESVEKALALFDVIGIRERLVISVGSMQQTVDMPTHMQPIIINITE